MCAAVAGESEPQKSHLASPAGPAGPAGQAPKVELTGGVMETLGPARVLDVPAHVRSLTFSDHGERLLVATEDGGVHMYNCLSGEHLGSSTLAPEGGVDLVRFTHGKNKVLFSSPGQSRVGYYDLALGEIVHSYEGHTGRYVSSYSAALRHASFMYGRNIVRAAAVPWPLSFEY